MLFFGSIVPLCRNRWPRKTYAVTMKSADVTCLDCLRVMKQLRSRVDFSVAMLCTGVLPNSQLRPNPRRGK